MEFGNTLREARELKGYTVSQVGDKTHIMVQIVEDLEHEDFSKIVAPIYGRGFVKLYCEAVGLDPKPMIEAFMACYNGEKAAGKPASKSIPAAEPVPAPTIAKEPPKNDTAATPAATPPIPEDPLFAHSSSPSRYAAPIPIDEHHFSMPAIPTSVWRTGLLLLITAGIVWLLGVGVVRLYRATMPEVPEPANTSDFVERAPDAITESGDSVHIERTPLEIDPLYAD